MSFREATELARPATDEYDPYYQGYVEKVPEGALLTTLESQSADVLALLENLDEDRAGYRYAAGKWSIKEVFGHIVDSERVFAFRALWFARGQPGPLPDMDPDAFATAAGFDACPLADLASEYASVRRSTVELLRGFSADQLAKRGVASGCEFTVRAIAFIIAGHERHHLEVLAARYDLC